MSASILITVTHLLGIGHLVRARQLARALAAAGHEVTLASGGMPDGKAAAVYRFVQLPPVRTEGTDFRNLLDEDGKAATSERLATRCEQLVTLARQLSPDIVVTEHFPFGRRQLAGEFLALIEAAKAARSGVLVLASIRDVLVAPLRPERLAETAERIATLFDAVLVHGDPSVLPLEASWPVTPDIAVKLVYTGYLAEPPALPGTPAESSRTILVSGGGSAAALPLFNATLAAARLLPQRPFHLLIGRGVSEADFTALRQSAPDNARVEWARPDFPALLAACSLSISQAGYNTVLDLLQAGRPALLVPFDAGNETEQALRAAALERAGLARVGNLGDGPQALACAIAAGLVQGAPPAARVDLDGAAGAVAAIAKLLVSRA